MDQGARDLHEALRVLAAGGWFSRRSKETRKQLSAIAKLRRFATNEAVYLAGDVPNGVLGLVSGSLNIAFPRADGEDYTLHRAGSGSWVGDLALFSRASPRFGSCRPADNNGAASGPAARQAVA